MGTNGAVEAMLCSNSMRQIESKKSKNQHMLCGFFVIPSTKMRAPLLFRRSPHPLCTKRVQSGLNSVQGTCQRRLEATRRPGESGTKWFQRKTRVEAVTITDIATKNAYLAAVRHIQYLLQSESKVASTQSTQGNNEWGLEAVLLCTNKMTLLYTSKFYG
jgi:hypothetical protein